MQWFLFLPVAFPLQISDNRLVRSFGTLMQPGNDCHSMVKKLSVTCQSNAYAQALQVIHKPLRN
jgi:hypothetical protein